MTEEQIIDLIKELNREYDSYEVHDFVAELFERIEKNKEHDP